MSSRFLIYFSLVRMSQETMTLNYIKWIIWEKIIREEKIFDKKQMFFIYFLFFELPNVFERELEYLILILLNIIII